MDSTLNQAFAALLTLAQASQTDLPVSRGPLSPAPGIALEPDPSAPAAQHMDGGCVIVLDIVINGKAADRRLLTNALHNLHAALTSRQTLPRGTSWQVTHIATQAFPALVQRLQDGLWLYASSITATVYITA